MPTPIAPFVSAFRRRLANLPGPGARGGGEASSGEPVVVELWVRGEWLDITSYCMVRDDNGKVEITSGIRSEGASAEFAVARLQLRNDDARFSPRNPSGPYYGAIGRNTPMRISVPDGVGGKTYVIWGDVTSWAPSWDRSGNDVWVDVTVSGPMWRLAQAPPPPYSVMRTAITEPLSSNLRAYWPCEDTTGSTTLASPLVSGSPMTFTGTPTLAGYDDFAAADPVVLMAGNVLTGGVARYSEPTMTQVRFLVRIPAEGLTDGKVICAVDQEDTGGTLFWELFYTTTGTTLYLRQCDGDGALLGFELAHTLDVRGRQLYVSIELQDSGGVITRALRLYDLTEQRSYDVSDGGAAGVSRVTQVQFGPASRSAVGPIGTSGLTDVAIGHVTVEDTITPVTLLGVHLNPVGETAGRRIQRLCAEEGIPFEWIGDLDDTVAMGAQPKQNALTHFREAELADGGMLYEARGGIGYRTRVALCNQDPQLVLDYVGNDLSEDVPTPVEDDRYIANKVTVTVSGVSATYEATDGPLSVQLPPTGVGVYGSEVTLNLSSSGQGASQAAWRVHMGTVDEPRYPKISVNLARDSFVNNPALKQAVLGLRQGDRIQVQNPPAWLPPGAIDQIILGIDPRSLTKFQHVITFVCAPASPYLVGVLDQDAARVDTDGSALLLAVDAADTELVVTPSTTDYARWTTTDAEFPFQVRCGGEIMTVTDISSFLYDTFTRSVSSGWGTSDNGQTWSTAGGVAGDFNVTAGAGGHTLSTTGASRRSFIDGGTAYSDFDFYGSITTSATATGGSLNGGLAARYVDSSNMYTAQLEFTTANTLSLTIRKRVNDVQTTLGTYALPDAYVAGTFYRVRFQGRGAVLRAKAWLASAVETPEWQITASDSALTNSPFFGLRSISDVANSNVNPIVSYDNLDLQLPQIFTVTRSVNGVSKAQVAGEDIRLAYPTIVSL